jgi:hypothetical protein
MRILYNNTRKRTCPYRQHAENFARVGVVEERGKNYAAVAFRGTVLNFNDDPNILRSVTNIKQDFYFYDDRIRQKSPMCVCMLVFMTR